MSTKIKLFALDYYGNPNEIVPNKYYGRNDWICNSCGTSAMTKYAYIKQGNLCGITIVLEDVGDVPMDHGDKLNKIKTKNGVISVITAS